MSAAIRVVEEQEVASDGAGGWVTQSTQAAPSAPVADPRVEAALGAIRTIDGIVGKNLARLAALEASVQGLPAAAGMFRALARALGAKILALIGLIGCLALAAETLATPSWQTIAILAIVVVGVQLPLVLVAYLKGQ